MVFKLPVVSAYANTLNFQVHSGANTDLNCWSALLAGFWELLGYGLFGVCKSDWDRFKGMDTESYKTKWGGEDWDLVDRYY